MRLAAGLSNCMVNPFSRNGSSLEAIAHSRLGQQMGCMRRIVLELASQLREKDTQIMSFLGVLGSPYLSEQLFAADQLAAIAHQHFQHAPFGRGQVNLLAVLDDPIL